jgi:hypothetical protein
MAAPWPSQKQLRHLLFFMPCQLFKQIPISKWYHQSFFKLATIFIEEQLPILVISGSSMKIGKKKAVDR